MFEDGGVSGSRKRARLGQLDLAPWERDGNQLPGGDDHLPGGGGTWCSRRSGLPTLCRGQSQLFCRMRVLNLNPAGGRVQRSAGLFLRTSAGQFFLPRTRYHPANTFLPQRYSCRKIFLQTQISRESSFTRIPHTLKMWLIFSIIA